ncbi:hypothetical protein H7827_20670 [Streptomyces sp. JH002]|uniref:hypothetical protein n=1 Tax=Streptomyces sp. JH002 TaxID=2763259 RepID=UPI003D804D2B
MATLNVLKIPRFTGNLEGLTDDYLSITALAGSISTTAKSLHDNFQLLRAYYQAPEGEDLFLSTLEVTTEGDEFKEELSEVSNALSEYVCSVQGVVARLASVRERAAPFLVCSVDDDTSGEQELKDELVREINSIVSEFQRAEMAAYNRIAVLYGGPMAIAYGADKALIPAGHQGEPFEYGLSADQLNAMKDLPWGTPSEPSRAWYEHAGSFFSGFFYTGLWGTVDSFFTLIPLNPLIGRAEWSDTGAAWKQLGLVGVGAATYIPPFGFLPDDWIAPLGQDGRQAFRNFGKEFLAWDTWSDEPGRALGVVVFNGVTIGSGTLLKMGKGGTTVSGASKGARGALTALGTIGKFSDPMLYVGKGMTGATNLGGNLARLGELNAGSRMLPDGSIRLHDGTTHRIDGTVQHANGTTVLPDNTIRMPQGSGPIQEIKPDGTMKIDGTEIRPDPPLSAAELDRLFSSPREFRDRYPTMSPTQVERALGTAADNLGKVPWGQINDSKYKADAPAPEPEPALPR